MIMLDILVVLLIVWKILRYFEFVESLIINLVCLLLNILLKLYLFELIGV